MEKKRRILLGAASILSLSAAAQWPAQASGLAEEALPAKATAASIHLRGDPLFDFISQTEGNFSNEVIARVLGNMLKTVSIGQIQELPGFYADLSAMGLSAKALSEVKRTLVKIISEANELDKNLRTEIISQLGGHSDIQVAQEQRRRRRPLPDTPTPPRAGGSTTPLTSPGSHSQPAPGGGYK